MSERSARTWPCSSKRRDLAVSGSPSCVGALAGNALDPGTERAQAFVDPLVPAVDLTDVSDLRDALCAEARDEHRHARPDVGALHALTMKTARTADDRSV